MTINLHLPGKTETLRPTITVVGVGGAGGNAVNNMINANLEGVNFVVANTDAQALENAMTERRIQLGSNLTRGLGAGASPEVGRAAAEEAMDEIAGYIEGSNMVFITAGMGGGTGTGAAPVIARLAKERGILTVGVVTKPFQFEGAHRMRLAEQGLYDLQQFVDTLIVIPNQNLFRIANEKTTFADAFRLADEVLHSGVRGVTDLMIMPGLINLDFADIRTVMREMGKAMMGTGEAEGPKRAIEAAEAAISNPLLDEVSMKGAKGVLINITGGYDMTLYEADEAATRIREEVDPDANIIFGATFNPALEGKMRVSVVATGIDLVLSTDPKPHPSPDGGNRFQGNKFNFGAPRPDAAKPSAPPTPPAAPKPMELASREPQRSAPAFDSKAAFESKAPLKDISGATRPAFLRAAPPVLASSVEPAPLPKSAAPQETPLAFAGKMRTALGAAAQAQGNSDRITPNAVPAREPSYTAHAAAPAPRNFAAPQAETVARKDAATASQPLPKSSLRDQASLSVSDAGSNSAMSFFQRMAGVGRVLASKAEPMERAVHVVEKPRSVAAERPASKPTAAEDAYLEIPAFLRRQAN